MVYKSGLELISTPIPNMMHIAAEAKKAILIGEDNDVWDHVFTEYLVKLNKILI